MKLKKMMAFVLCATAVAGLGLTGCGNSSDNSAAGDGTSAAKESSDAGRQTHLIFPEISQYYPVRMVPVQEVLSSSCLELKRKMKQARKRT